MNRKKREWSPQRKKLVGRIILAKFLELPLEEYKKFIDKVERTKLFKRLARQGCLSLKEFPNSGVFDKFAELPANCIALIEGNKIYYAHPRFNGGYVAHHKSGAKNLLRYLRKISTRNQLTHAILDVIINYQKKYLESGKLFNLKPLTGQMIKDMAGKKCVLINNCVISRLIKNKTIMPPWRGVISLKDLISSKKKIYKKHIKDIIQEEYSSDNFRRLLDDNMIKERLKRRYEISASRRSVCQARKELGISSWKRRRKKPYCQLALRIFSAFYPLERKAINRYAPESPGAYELCINKNELAYPKRKSGKFYIGGAKNIKKRLMTHLNPNHKNTIIAGYLKNHGCFFRFAIIASNWRKTEKMLYDLFIATYGASPIGNKLSP